MFKSFYKNKYKSGMTAVELMIVLSIFTIISSIVMFSYGKFNSSLSLQNLADDIALTIRKAQSYAIGVRGLDKEFFNGYGIHFTTMDPDSNNLLEGSNKSFILFADIVTTTQPGNKSYDYDSIPCGAPSLGNECLELLNITTADKIEGIYLDASTEKIPNDNSLDIVFTRPFPDAKFCHKSSPGDDCNTDSISYVKIKVLNTKDEIANITKTITVFNTGQISVE